MSRIEKKNFLPKKRLKKQEKTKKNATKKFEVIFHCRRMFFPPNHCLLIFRLKRTQIPSVGVFFSRKKGEKNTFQSHHDKTVSAYLFEGKDIHCFDKLCMNFTYADASISLCVMFQKFINFSSPVLESSHPNWVSKVSFIHFFFYIFLSRALEGKIFKAFWTK